MWALPALLSVGCAVRGDMEMLESELRRQEQAQQELSEQLQSAQQELRVARADADSLRTQLTERGQLSLVSEQAAALYKAEAIRFNMLLTSGVNRDGHPGDESLSVLLLPVDAHGDMVKLPGAVDLELLDLTRSGDDQRVGSWKFTVDEVNEHWHRGFMSAGLLFHLDWQQAPTTPELTLHAKFTAPDGRAFDATTQIKVAPPSSTVPSPIAQAQHVTDGKAGTVTPAAGERPTTPTKPKAASRRTSVSKSGPTPIPKGRPGHTRLRTSDSYTDETIPRLR